jgi:hypothetical protein
MPQPRGADARQRPRRQRVAVHIDARRSLGRGGPGKCQRHESHTQPTNSGSAAHGCPPGSSAGEPPALRSKRHVLVVRWFGRQAAGQVAQLPFEVGALPREVLF